METVTEDTPHVVLTKVNDEVSAVEYLDKASADAGAEEARAIRPWAEVSVQSSEDFRKDAEKAADDPVENAGVGPDPVENADVVNVPVAGEEK